ncbi:MAG: heparan-alpha-glucosaminide N-acetyltransferase domain-containing protein [Fodinibius sp.]|nr:heparan-alpha-glucosaminide N-acetyltransferase domain-containing protein [Fodinibius sp.]
MVQRTERLVSLDVFRGITIAGMILVNNPGSWSHVYPPLLHAEWHGWTPTDLIFPFFLFIVGVAMTYSFGKMFEQGISKSEIYKKVCQRAAILFAIGLFMAIFPLVRFDPLRLYDFSTMRIMGVLQRIALCYLFASIIYLEFRNIGAQLFWLIGLLAGYWLVMTIIPVPGHGAGNMSQEGNLAAYIDQLIMTDHLWKPGWDPEGLLSTIPAIGTVLIGLLTGSCCGPSNQPKTKLYRCSSTETLGSWPG